MKIDEFIHCDCFGHALHIYYDDEEDFCKGASISFWEYGHWGKGSPWKTRLNHIKQILKNGHPYADMIDLSGKELDKLIEVLMKIREAINE